MTTVCTACGRGGLRGAEDTVRTLGEAFPEFADFMRLLVEEIDDPERQEFVAEQYANGCASCGWMVSKEHRAVWLSKVVRDKARAILARMEGHSLAAPKETKNAG